MKLPHIEVIPSDSPPNILLGYGKISQHDPLKFNI
jgi:hypothetical protein